MLRVFIGWDSRFPEPARVLAYTLRKRASEPLAITYLDKDYLRHCFDWHRRVDDPLATTEFTYSRFLVPYLCGYRGPALFLDNDMACFADPAEMLPWPKWRDWPSWPALQVVQHDHRPAETTKMYGCPQTSYPRKNWSSLMLMNCNRLRAWTPEVVATATGKQLHRFEDVPDGQIAPLDPCWNVLDHVRGDLGKDTKILHWTSGGPWSDPDRTWPHQDLWFDLRKEWIDAGRP